MGCDIHAHLEIKVNDKWEHWSALNLGRDYELFGLMAGVRGDLDPVSQPKGLPEDASLLTKMDSDKWDSDGHTHSWLSSNELALVIEQLKAQPGRDKWALQREFGYVFGDYPQERDDVRIVFWFDN